MLLEELEQLHVFEPQHQDFPENSFKKLLILVLVPLKNHVQHIALSTT